MLALIAGEGALPRLIHQSHPDALVCELEGFPSGLVAAPLVFRIERLGTFLSDLRQRSVTEVCFAGRVGRPALDPAAVDRATLPLVPRMMEALRSGDDGALRIVMEIFEEQDFAVRAAHEILPHLLPDAGVLTRAGPSDRDRADAARAQGIATALGIADVGQSCCVAAGQALAVEALGGTDWMLETLAGGGRPGSATGGIFYKAPKPGQDRRADLPVIGPETVAGVAAAGLSGLVIEAGGVMILDREATVDAADAAGLFLWVRAP